MKRAHHPYLFIPALTALASLAQVVTSAHAASRVERPEAVLRFSAADGWGEPRMELEPDGRTLLIRLDAAPANVLPTLASQLDAQARRAVARVELNTTRHGVTLRVLLRNRLHEATRTRQGRQGAWLVTVVVGLPDPVDAGSYESLVPPGMLQAILSVTDLTIAAGVPVCEGLVALSRDAEPWSAWVQLRLADCWRAAGHTADATAMATQLAVGRTAPRSVAALAGLRLSEWPGSWSPWYSIMKPDDVTQLPPPVVQELGLRLTRRAIRVGDRARAEELLLAVGDTGPIQPELRASLDATRLEVLDLLGAQGDGVAAARVLRMAPLPLPDEPAYLPMLRHAALVSDRLGLSAQAGALAEKAVQSDGLVIDLELAAIRTRALLAGRPLAQSELMPYLQSGSPAWDALAVEGELSPPAARAVAAWLLEAWDQHGAQAAAEAAQPLVAADPTGTVAEARLASWMGAGRCAELLLASPADLPPEARTFAALCELGKGNWPAASAAVARVPAIGEDEGLRAAVQDLVESSIRFGEATSNLD